AMAARDADSSVAQRAEAASETLQLQGKVAGSRTADVRLLRGVVRDAGSQEPIAGAAVLVPGAAAAVVTDEEGRFALPVSPGDTSVVVRVIGFQPARLDLAQGAPLDSTTVMLQPDITLLEELAVTGADAAQRDVLLEAWLADGASPNDPRVTSVAGCWALVGGRVPGATEGVVLRL